MTLSFPNPSRSFEMSRNAVSFTGYDGMFEVSFFVQADTLAATDAANLTLGTMKEKCLAGFDALRESIFDVAREAYSNRRLRSYILTSEDFRKHHV